MRETFLLRLLCIFAAERTLEVLVALDRQSDLGVGENRIA